MGVMLLASLYGILIGAFLIVYKALDHGLVSPFFSFAKGVEFAIILGFAVAFFLLSILIALRQAKRLPKSYRIEVTDIFGQDSAMEGLRLSFSTYSVAESYARHYRDTYKGQFQFRVVGIYGSEGLAKGHGASRGRRTPHQL